MSKRTPYDTGKRSEPKVWGKGHIEDDDDYGKVDFEDDAGGTLATLYIEQSDDRSTYTLKGWTNESLKIDIDSDIDATVTLVTEEEFPEIDTIHWFPDDLVVRMEGMVPRYGQVVQSERLHGMSRLWVQCPGIAKPELWDGTECRLLHRVNKNKEQRLT